MGKLDSITGRKESGDKVEKNCIFNLNTPRVKLALRIFEPLWTNGYSKDK